MGKLCQYCGKREAKIHFWDKSKEGKPTEVHVCEPCAHEKNMAHAFPSLLTHIVKGTPFAGRGEVDTVPAACPQCGLAYGEFKAKGRLGCPACYDAFSPVLVPLLEKVHGSARHTGRIPERLRRTLASGEEMAKLEAELATAVAAEDYESAARLRDRIKSLTGEPDVEP